MTMPWAIGLMTGTVLDGNVDIAMIRTDGSEIAEFGPWELAPYPEHVPPVLEEALKQARLWNFEGPEPAIFAEAEALLTRAQSEAVNTFLKKNGMAASDVAAIGFHGQTVLHRAPSSSARGKTRQLGSGSLMARITGIDTVFDFRTADIEAGGQGAPLSAIYHAGMLSSIGAGPETAILNLGGVANVSWTDGETLVAFDTGPANAPVNDWIKAHGRGAFDRDGKIAASGKADEARLQKLLGHPYLVAPYPKSLDRFDFGMQMADGLDLEDGAATLTAFTAAAVGKALDILPVRPERLIVCGGGRRNPVMLAEISKRAGVQADAAEKAGFRGDAVEAECFAYLAMRRLNDLPISFPTTTGVPAQMSGGRIARA
ncbi:anhydro-N-acetylmuramic acid kinase [Pseudohoeflea suaedae]|uniref:Anhydro-N-acetylmuramic acid kinase n=1 Tax=Pseudohoeflea suaedae TaxID=877384 RepID=A0A4R5PKN2_9HYPH|nr:anhydro-N-acetylmuramic acid kinase [Pseudohoeflea suaedae]TDH36283.1 anhydro-N-acetylmuramic acid kinase [Pseudohoeflea suaedae]